MARIAFIADVHLANHRIQGGPTIQGVNTRCLAILRALRDAVEVAEEEGCERLVILGDLFDHTRPSPQILDRCMAALTSTLPVDILVGNHDQVSDAAGDNALAPLQHLANVRVVEHLLIHMSGTHALAVVPFQTGPGIEWLSRDVASARASVPTAQHLTVAMHLGILEESMLQEASMFWAKTAHDAVTVPALMQLAAEHGVDQFMAGNWHGRYAVEGAVPDPAGGERPVRICQVGALVPTGWDNPGLTEYGTVAILDTDTRQTTYVEVPGPRFITVRSQEELAAALELFGHHTANRLYVRWIAPPAEMRAARDVLQQLAEPGHPIEAFEVIPSKEDVRERAQAAAAAARSADTLGEALAKYIDETPWADSLDRKRLLNTVREFIA